MASKKNRSVIVSEQWMDGLIEAAARMQQNLKTTEGLSELDKSFVGIIVAELTGYVASAKTIKQWGAEHYDAQVKLLDDYRAYIATQPPK